MKKYFVAMYEFVLSLFKPKESEWYDGYPPSNLYSGYYVTGMRVDENTPKNVIPTWKYSPAYYARFI